MCLGVYLITTKKTKIKVFWNFFFTPGSLHSNFFQKHCYWSLRQTVHCPPKMDFFRVLDHCACLLPSPVVIYKYIFKSSFLVESKGPKGLRNNWELTCYRDFFCQNWQLHHFKKALAAIVVIYKYDWHIWHFFDDVIKISFFLTKFFF